MRPLRSEQAPSSADSAKRLVLAALRRADSLRETVFKRKGVPFQRDSVRFYDAEQSIVPGLRYISGVYVPPRTADIFYRAAAAYTVDNAFRPSQPTDIMRAVRRLGWWPESASAGAAICGELIRYTGGAFLPQSPPVIFTGWQQLRKYPTLDSSDYRRLRAAQVTPPRLDQDGVGRVLIRLWAIEEGYVTRQYDCRLDRDGRATLGVRDSIVGVGFFRL
jgi:hypothetical protein